MARIAPGPTTRQGGRSALRRLLQGRRSTIQLPTCSAHRLEGVSHADRRAMLRRGSGVSRMSAIPRWRALCYMHVRNPGSLFVGGVCRLPACSVSHCACLFLILAYLSSTYALWIPRRKYLGVIRLPDEPHGDAGGCLAPWRRVPATATDVFGDLQSVSRAFGSHHVVPLDHYHQLGDVMRRHPRPPRARPRVDGADAKRERIRKTLLVKYCSRKYLTHLSSGRSPFY